MAIEWQTPDTETASRQLTEALRVVETAVAELERAQTVSKETLECTISI
jgi:hypothetical protein